MYLISIIVLIVVIISMLFMGGAGGVTVFIDFPNLLLLILIVLPILAGTNMLKDFNSAFRFAMSRKKNFNIPELRRASEAVTLVMQTLLYAGMLISITGIIFILRQSAEMELDFIFANFAVAVLPIFYVMGFNLILLLIRAKINRMIIDFVQE